MSIHWFWAAMTWNETYLITQMHNKLSSIRRVHTLWFTKFIVNCFYYLNPTKHTHSHFNLHIDDYINDPPPPPPPPHTHTHTHTHTKLQFWYCDLAFNLIMYQKGVFVLNTLVHLQGLLTSDNPWYPEMSSQYLSNQSVNYTQMDIPKGRACLHLQPECVFRHFLYLSSLFYGVCYT